MEPITINLHYLVQLKRFDLGACFQFKIVSLGLHKSFRGVNKKKKKKKNTSRRAIGCNELAAGVHSPSVS